MSTPDPWASIPYAQPGEIICQRAEADHPLDLFWGRDHLGACFLSLQTRDAFPAHLELPSLRGIAIQRFKTPHSDEIRLSVNQGNLREMFRIVCQDLIRSSAAPADTTTALMALLDRLSHWQRLLAKGVSGLLDENRVRGLLAEVRFLSGRLVPRFGVDAIAMWGGPKGAVQDFQVGPAAYEVKSHRPIPNPAVTISSLDQLSTGSGRLFLITYPVGPSAASAGGVTLKGLIDQVRVTVGSGPASDRFEESLSDAGYFDHTHYEEQSWFIGEPGWYEVVDGFPRITGGMVPPGIGDVNYRIQLAACSEFSCPEWIPGIGEA